MSPRFLFTIDEIKENPNATHNVDRLGNWYPSAEVGANVRDTGGVSGQTWFCNTQRVYPIAQPIPDQSTLYKRFSVYFVSGVGFWVLHGDATDPADLANGDDWLPLRFDYTDNEYSSFLTNAGEHPTLRIQRPDQLWPTMLLPDIYHAPVYTTSQGYGGLIGELPILLALLAISLPRHYLPSVLPTLFTNGTWNVHGYQFPRINQRGVVVAVHTCPQNWSGGSTIAELTQYESGALGKYYN